jgi:hypothetical protein
MNSILISFIVAAVPTQVTIHNYSSISNADLTKTYAIAKQVFIDVTGCDSPVAAELTIKEVPFAELNKDQAIFIDGGISVVIGLYISSDKTIEIAAEHPDKEYVLFHELAHFLFSNSIRCSVFSDNSKVQHAYIATFENMFIEMTGRSRTKLSNTEWITDALRKNGIDIGSVENIK